MPSWENMFTIFKACNVMNQSEFFLGSPAVLQSHFCTKKTNKQNMLRIDTSISYKEAAPLLPYLHQRILCSHDNLACVIAWITESRQPLRKILETRLVHKGEEKQHGINSVHTRLQHYIIKKSSDNGVNSSTISSQINLPVNPNEKNCASSWLQFESFKPQ